MEEKRMAGNYEVTTAFEIGTKEIIIGEDKTAAPDERFVVANYENNGIFERYVDALVSNDYAEISKIFAERIKNEAELVIEEISKIDDNTFTVDGTIDIEEIEELIGKELPEGDYETLAGFIIDQLQFLPKDGEMNEVEFENVKFTVLKVDERRIEKIKVEITPLPESEDDDDDDEDEE